MKVGLVLGAGGAAGAAYHGGTLLALEHDLGWDPRSADVIVGSSAGSVVATLLRAGLTADDLAAWGALVPALPAGRAGRLVLDSMDEGRVRLVPSSPWWSVPDLRLVLRMTRGRTPLHTAVMALL